MAIEDADMELRVKSLEDGMRGLRDEVSKLKEVLNAALLGTMEGKPGIMASLKHSIEASQANAVTLGNLTSELRRQSEQIDGLRLDRAKVTGIVLAVSALWGFLVVMLKYWR